MFSHYIFVWKIRRLLQKCMNESRKRDLQIYAHVFLFSSQRKCLVPADESPRIMTELADVAVRVRLQARRTRERGVRMYVAPWRNGGGRKLMQVNRIFHYRLLGLRSTGCNGDESYNSEAAGRSFVPQYTHIIQPAPVDKSSHTHKHFHMENFLKPSPAVDQANSVDLCLARLVSSAPLFCNL